MSLESNLSKIKNDIVTLSSGSVRLVAATKTQTTETIETLWQLDDSIIMGENRVQELLEKYDPKYVWDFIGQLQTNKVKYIIDKVDIIHSVDRLSLAAEIDKCAKKVDKIQKVLVEINVAAEPLKGGILTDEVNDFVLSLANFDNIEVAGIMAVMPNEPDTKKLESYYLQLKIIYDNLKDVKGKNVNIRFLSAGMSNDYQIALKFDANVIRTGRVLFGERVY